MPLPLLILLLLIGGISIGAILSETKKKVTSASDCNDLFLMFNENLKFPPTKRRLLLSSREAIKKKLTVHFRNKSGIDAPRFWIQGSYKIGTVIRNQKDTCDVDVGIYFPSKPSITPLSIFQNIVNALDDHTDIKAEIRNKCVRLYYSTDFHIDLPVYYESGGQFFLAVKGGTWEPSDPKLFREWFRKETKNNEQVIRIIRYLKAWADTYKKKTGQKMPSGLALSIWAIKYFEGDSRDDVALFNTTAKLLADLREYWFYSWECTLPVEPKDNVTAKQNYDQRKNFITALKKFSKNTIEAITAESREKAAGIWQSEFGRWFPETF